jgi:uncharacterized SAM-binding protein YcdF (DUF218 family)
MSLLKRCAIGIAAISLLLVVTFLCRRLLLHAAADCWIVDQPVTQADAIVVLGGGLQTRPFAAAKFHQQGKAPKILVMNVKPSPTTELGLTPTEQELTRKVLLAQGVPASDLVEIGDHVASSHDEALAVRDWLILTGATHLIIPTDPFHTRRVSWLYDRQLRDLGVKVLVTAVPQLEYTPADWWFHEEGLIAFQNEVIKYLFYRFKY